MTTIINLINLAHDILDKVNNWLSVFASLLLRIYLVPVFWVAGNNKWNPFDPDSSLQNTINWFANPDWGLGLPFPAVNAYLAWSTEYVGAILLALGLATRWVSIPLMATMIVAATTVHISHGWQAIHDPMSPFASASAPEAIERLSRAREILHEHGNYEWLTEHGSLVALNNGVEWAATYLVMLLALFILGGGKYISLDYWIKQHFRSK